MANMHAASYICCFSVPTSQQANKPTSQQANKTSMGCFLIYWQYKIVKKQPKNHIRAGNNSEFVTLYNV
jgi:hypothetical protein